MFQISTLPIFYSILRFFEAGSPSALASETHFWTEADKDENQRQDQAAAISSAAFLVRVVPRSILPSLGMKETALLDRPSHWKPFGSLTWINGDALVGVPTVHATPGANCTPTFSDPRVRCCWWHPPRSERSARSCWKSTWMKWRNINKISLALAPDFFNRRLKASNSTHDSQLQPVLGLIWCTRIWISHGLVRNFNHMIFRSLLWKLPLKFLVHFLWSYSQHFMMDFFRGLVITSPFRLITRSMIVWITFLLHSNIGISVYVPPGVQALSLQRLGALLKLTFLPTAP